MNTGLQVVLLFALVLWTAFFVAAEYAFVASRPTRMRELAEQGNRRATRVLAVQQNPTRFISSVQVAITFSGLAIGAVGEPAVRRLVGDLIDPLGPLLSTGLVTVLSVIIGFVIIIAITVVLGEIVPKSLALAHTEAIALAVVRPVGLFTSLIHPFVWMLERLAALTLRIFGLRGDIRLGRGHSEEEIKMILAASFEEGVLQAEESEMLSRVFDFADTEARQVMVPRPDVVGLPLSASVAEAAAIAETHPYTRYPVYGDDLDDIRGVVHIRQLFEAARAGDNDKWVRDLVRPVDRVPETKNLDDLLRDFRRSQSHLAVVVDEYGSLAGVVTLEDLVEEVMGEIDDEFDTPTLDIVHTDGGHALVAGSVSLEDFNERFGTNIDDEDVNTVAGAVLHAMGRVPEVGDQATAGDVAFTVVEMDGSRIVRVRAIIGRSILDAPDPPRGAADG
ncbi:MAG: HlyC/CorC family transporter [Thermoleophilia bacterium]|nr:HlyC/CorC family transporter [Thermoleophilia bacterium]